ncbi:TetR/AcrR family transcriptional regulator [Lachnospiraceae bacterium PF1-21]|uniref:TetR/AcrR family transcriptional regulator n=1 Tax=Ohessyouella blattaphilus TaxID=2949333 RepID=UPI003E26FEA6
MYQHFYALPEEKQQRIRNAAFREFGKNGYKKTSTEQIATAAGISKAMVFHYFRSKIGLFEYLFESGTTLIKNTYGNVHEQLEGKDFIKQYQLLSEIKLKAMKELPELFEFFAMFYLREENRQVSAKCVALYEELIQFQQSVYSLVYKKNSHTPFRKDLPEDQLKNYISWLFEGYTSSLIAKIKETPFGETDFAPYWKEYFTMLTDLETLFYEPKEDV